MADRLARAAVAEDSAAVARATTGAQGRLNYPPLVLGAIRRPWICSSGTERTSTGR